MVHALIVVFSQEHQVTREAVFKIHVVRNRSCYHQASVRIVRPIQEFHQMGKLVFNTNVVLMRRNYKMEHASNVIHSQGNKMNMNAMQIFVTNFPSYYRMGSANSARISLGKRVKDHANQTVVIIIQY